MLSNKKLIYFSIFLAIVFVVTNTLIISAKDLDPNIKINLNGEEILFKENEGKPTICDTDILIPIRNVFEALGYNVEWADKTWFSGNQKIYIGKELEYIMLEVDCCVANINGEEFDLTTRDGELKKEYNLTLRDCVTYLPLSFISEYFVDEVVVEDIDGNINVSLLKNKSIDLE